MAAISSSSSRRQSERRITAELIYLELQDDYESLWFDLFYGLGLNRDKLEFLQNKYSKDPKVCAYEAAKLWIEQGDPKPSWERISHVLRYKLLDPKHADRIDASLGLLVPEQPVHGGDDHIIEEQIIDLFGKDNNSPFGQLLVEIMDEFFNTPSPYIAAFHVNTLCCPNGSRMIDKDLIRYNHSIDGVFLPLILHNYFSHYDIDFLVYLIDQFGKTKSLLPHLEKFYVKRKLGNPIVRRIRNLHQNFMVRCIFGDNARGINWKMVTDIKKKLRALFGLEEFMYIMHFIGWSINPLSFCYQLPLACMGVVSSALEPYPSSMLQVKIVKIVVEVGSAKFSYDSIPT